MKQNDVQKLMKIAMIAAVYSAVSLLLAPLSFGAVQIRVAEALTLLPLLSFLPVWGLTLGCALTNLIGAMTGVNILGFWDVLFGTLATLIAAYFTYRFRFIRYKGIPWVSALFPIVVNGIIIGAELAILLDPTFTGFLVFAGYVALGEALSVLVIGIPLMKRMEKGNFAKYFSVS